MKIAICLGVVPDTTTKVRFTDENTQFDTNGIQWVINPWDELALTRALEMKEKGGIDKVSIITVGDKASEAVIRKGLAIGADDAIRIDTNAKDSYFTASQLAAYFKENPYDIIFTGIEASDYNGSSVGGMLAEMLDYNSVSAVSYTEVNADKLMVHRDIDGGKQVIEMATPAVAIVQKGITKEPRIAAMRGIMMARKKPLTVVAAVEVDCLTEMVDYHMPETKSACKMIDADNAAELVNLLHNEAKVI